MLVVNYEQLLRAVFSCFHGQKLILDVFFTFRVRTKKLLDTKVKFFLKIWEVFLGGLKFVFLGLAVLFFY